MEIPKLSIDYKIALPRSGIARALVRHHFKLRNRLVGHGGLWPASPIQYRETFEQFAAVQDICKHRVSRAVETVSCQRLNCKHFDLLKGLSGRSHIDSQCDSQAKTNSVPISP